MMSDERTYVRVHDGIEDHPKTAALSDRAFRLLITTWGWCSRHLTDGRVPMRIWNQRGTPKTRRELVDAELVEAYDDHIIMHDYLEHQRSAAEVEEKREAKRKAGALGNHNRWHVGKKHEPDCPICVANGSHEGSHEGSQVRSVDNSVSSENNSIRHANDRQNDAHTEVDGRSKTASQVQSSETRSPAQTAATVAKTGSQVRSHSGRKTSPEVETEVEVEVDIPRATGAGGSHQTPEPGKTPTPETPNSERPNDRCPRHHDVDDPPPCGQCADARRAAEAWDQQHAERRRQAAEQLEQATRDRRYDCEHGTPGGAFTRVDGTLHCSKCRRKQQEPA